jgi:hypothetical protein
LEHEKEELEKLVNQAQLESCNQSNSISVSNGLLLSNNITSQSTHSQICSESLSWDPNFQSIELDSENFNSIDLSNSTELTAPKNCKRKQKKKIHSFFDNHLKDLSLEDPIQKKKLTTEICIRVKKFINFNKNRDVHFNNLEKREYGLYMQFYCKQFLIKKCKKLFVVKYNRLFDKIEIFEDEDIICEHYFNIPN